ncbi:tetratricopeptide repeat (TPR)-like superfamily protein [Tasmannia lanceolata]|uniref:tetratricopeptide repeat (TPR)-like superfamily protein n=1 Tax=Tasmannia lanceolata TaxID=3420 RepID=UPI0040630259
MKRNLLFTSFPSLFHCLEMGSASSFHRLVKTQLETPIINRDPVLITKHISGNTNNLIHLFSNRHDSFIFPTFALSSYRSIHGFAKIETSDDSPNFVSNQISESTEKICQILSNQASSSIESSLEGSGIRVSPALVEDVLKKLSNAGILALSFFRWAEKQEGFKHTTESFHALIEALGKIKQFRLIWNLVDTMKDKGLLTKETFAVITRRYARARKIKEAIATFERMVNYGLKTDISDFNRLIDTISKSRHVKRAQEIFDQMKNKRFSPDLKTYTILLEGWGHDRNLLRLREIYHEMRDEGFEPDVVTYGILINAYCKSRKHDEALELFHEMEKKGCRPSPHIYCSLINGLGSEKRLSEALKFFELSKDHGFVPEIPTYNAVVGSYCWAMQFEDAYRVLDEMKKCGIGPNSRTFDVLIHHLIKAKKTKEAYDIFQRMEGEHGCEPSLNAYTMMVGMFCSEERVDMALKVWKQMNDKGVLPCMHMFSSLINGLCDENRLDEACNYFEEMMEKGIRPPGQLYSNLKQVLLDGGKKDLAINLAQKLDKLRRTPMNG